MKNSKAEAIINIDERKLTLHDKVKWSINWPVWLYDFTVRSRIPNFFVFKVAHPVRIYSNYFEFEDENEENNGGIDDLGFILVPYQNHNITIFDDKNEIRRKRMESGQIFDSYLKEETPNHNDDESNQLLMARESHLWVYPDFENHFHKLFDEESNILFQNWTIHKSYGWELESFKSFDTFLKEILSSNEIDKLK